MSSNNAIIMLSWKAAVEVREVFIQAELLRYERYEIEVQATLVRQKMDNNVQV